MHDITRLLSAMHDGDDRAGEDLLRLVYEKLRSMAAGRMAGEVHEETLQATALVHEAWMQLKPQDHEWNGRAHFFGAAAEAMRRILIQRARRRLAAKRGSGIRPLPMDQPEGRSAMDVPVPVETDDRLLALHDALDRLAESDPQKAEIVKLRYFTGLSIPEAAEVMGISVATANRHWAFSRAWLLREIERAE